MPNYNINLSPDVLFTSFFDGNTDEVTNFVRNATPNMLDEIASEVYNDEVLWEEVTKAVRAAAAYTMNNRGECDICGNLYALGADDHCGTEGTCWDCCSCKPKDEVTTVKYNLYVAADGSYGDATGMAIICTDGWTSGDWEELYNASDSDRRDTALRISDRKE